MIEKGLRRLRTVCIGVVSGGVADIVAEGRDEEGCYICFCEVLLPANLKTEPVCKMKEVDGVCEVMVGPSLIPPGN